MTNFYDAQYGRTGGGVISVSTKSGTNNITEAFTSSCAATNGTRTTLQRMPRVARSMPWIRSRRRTLAATSSTNMDLPRRAPDYPQGL